MPKTNCVASDLTPLLDGSSAGELIPELVRQGLQLLIELEVAAMLGAERHERTDERLGYRNGSRPRTLTTQVGDIPLAIPKLRSGSFFPISAAIVRLVEEVLLEQDKHWQLEGRRMFSLDSTAAILPAVGEFPAVTAADPQAAATA